MGKLFDTHAHYTDERLRGNTSLLDSLFATDISHILTVATNLSDTEDLVTVMWANECFDPNKPDTFFEPVENRK